MRTIKTKKLELRCITKGSKHYGEIHTYSDWRKHLPFGLAFVFKGEVGKRFVKVMDGEKFVMKLDGI